MEKVKKNGRYGYLIGCCDCGSELFRTTAKYYKNPDKNYCLKCAAKNASNVAASNKKHTQNDNFFEKSNLETYQKNGSKTPSFYDGFMLFVLA